jgi:D-alanyl-D-alanine carboxypeptidase
MNQPLRSTTAVSIVLLSSMIAGCAAPRARTSAASTPYAGKVDLNAALATRALAALDANNVPVAIDLAEKAVAKSPDEVAVRTLLANAYFAGGRFHSAEAAFRDSLTLDPNQPQVVLKLALVQIAQGKNREAVAFLNSARNVLDASDYGLALALAGRPGDAIAVLDPAARRYGADATVRQNLALAHALAGHWTEARTIAAQDVPAGQLDARIQQWMQLAAPKHPADQVAALVGVTPAAVDAGEPVQLALTRIDTPVAVAQVAPAPVPVVPVVPVVPARAAASVQPAPPVAVAAFQPAPMPAPRPVVHASVPPAPPPARSTLVTLASSAVTEAKAVLASVLPYHQSAPAPRRVRVQHAAVPVAMRRGNAPTVVQLGAYGSPERVLTAWNGAAKKYGALKAYLPMSARFQSAKGTFYRLSVRGFSSYGEANALCASLRHEGGKCFVRNFAGDTPVQYASR